MISDLITKKQFNIYRDILQNNKLINIYRDISLYFNNENYFYLILLYLLYLQKTTYIILF